MEQNLMGEKLIFNRDVDDLSLEAVEVFFSEVRRVASEKDKVYVGLSGGRSLISFYENVVTLSYGLDDVFWRKIVFFFVDERLVSLDSVDSNYRQIKEIFFDKLSGIILPEQIEAINLNLDDVVEDYNLRIERADIVLLGSGPDGHVASLFPNHSSIMDEGGKFILVENSPKPPSNRISMSRKMISDTEIVFLFFIGEEKKKAYEMFLNPELVIEKSPCKIAKDAEIVYIVTDLNMLSK